MLLTERLWKWGWNCCVAPLGYVPGGNRILIAGYRPAQKFCDWVNFMCTLIR